MSHQANRRIIQSATEKLGVDPDKVIINIERFGNTTAATIPLALNDAVCAGRLKKGDLVLLASVGAGFTVGAVLLRWGFCWFFSFFPPAPRRGRAAEAGVVAERAAFALAEQLRSTAGAPLGDVFSVRQRPVFPRQADLRAAVRRAARPEPDRRRRRHIITPNAGLRSPDTLVTHAAVRAFAGGDVDPANAQLPTAARTESARAAGATIGPDCDVVLLGSIASPKYVDVLLGASSASGCGFRSISSAAAT